MGYNEYLIHANKENIDKLEKEIIDGNYEDILIKYYGKITFKRDVYDRENQKVFEKGEEVIFCGGERPAHDDDGVMKAIFKNTNIVFSPQDYQVRDLMYDNDPYLEELRTGKSYNTKYDKFPEIKSLQLSLQKLSRMLFFDIAQNPESYKLINKDFVSTVNLLFGKIDYLDIKIKEKSLTYYCNSTDVLLKDIAAEGVEEIKSNLANFLSQSLIEESTKFNIIIEPKFDTLNLSKELKIELYQNLENFDKTVYQSMGSNYIERLANEINVASQLREEEKLIYNLARISRDDVAESDDVYKFAKQAQSKLAKIDLDSLVSSINFNLRSTKNELIDEIEIVEL